ncbi:MAG: DNA-protecting protein DprA [Turicibacter sp.]|nr:DNA-protecting protein DprA [Turicibacter sp.]
MELKEKLIALSILKNGNWLQMYDVLNEDIQLNQLTKEQVSQATSKLKGINVLTILDENYPECFKEMPRPPFVLYYQGDIQLLKNKKVGVMGNRRPSTYGIDSCHEIAHHLLASNITILGNLQLGIDTIAHTCAVKYGKTIAILSTGFFHIYPSENYALFKRLAQDHLVLTEYPPHVHPSATQFHRAHQLVQELSDVMIVIEAVKEDKRLNTVQQLVDDGKVIYALPAPYHSTHSAGSLHLIKQGAYCFTHCEEVIERLDWIYDT